MATKFIDDFGVHEGETHVLVRQSFKVGQPAKITVTLPNGTEMEFEVVDEAPDSGRPASEQPRFSIHMSPEYTARRLAKQPA